MGLSAEAPHSSQKRAEWGSLRPPEGRNREARTAHVNEGGFEWATSRLLSTMSLQVRFRSSVLRRQWHPRGHYRSDEKRKRLALGEAYAGDLLRASNPKRQDKETRRS